MKELPLKRPCQFLLKWLLSGRHSFLWSGLFLLVWVGNVLTPWFNFKVFQRDWIKEWERYDVPAMVPVFADLRGITHSVDCWHLGAKLYEHNPCSPFGLKYNYPRWLLYLHYFGVNAESTELLGLICTGGFLLSVALVTRPKKFLDFSCLLMIVTSMPVMLAIERGNCDLIVFILVALYLLMCSRYSIFCYTFLLLAAFIKIFPTFAYLATVRERSSAFIRIALFLFIINGIYLFLSWPDLASMRAATPQSPVLSYGYPRVGPSLALLSESNSRHAIMCGIIAFTVVVLMAVSRIIRQGFTKGLFSDHAIRSFLCGGGIFLGTWISTTNFCYRLIFLILLHPLFSEFFRGHLGEKLIGASGLILIILSLHAESSLWLTSQGIDELVVLLLAGVVFSVCILLVIRHMSGRVAFVENAASRSVQVDSM